MAAITDQDVLRAVLRQFSGNLDYQVIADELGLPTKDAARKRWTRIKKNIDEGKKGEASATGADPTTKNNPKVQKVVKTPKTPKSSKPAEKKTPGRGSKKRKMASSDVEEDDEVERNPKDAIDHEETISQEPTPKTKSKKLPATKSSVSSLTAAKANKEDSIEDVVNEENVVPESKQDIEEEDEEDTN